MPYDEFKVTFDENGTIKIETDGVSQANHTNAEGLLKAIESAFGNKAEVTLKPGHFEHQHRQKNGQVIKHSH